MRERKFKREIRKLQGGEYDEIKDHIRESASVNADETGWRIKGINHWL